MIQHSSTQSIPLRSVFFVYSGVLRADSTRTTAAALPTHVINTILSVSIQHHYLLLIMTNRERKTSQRCERRKTDLRKCLCYNTLFFLYNHLLAQNLSPEDSLCGHNNPKGIGLVFVVLVWFSWAAVKYFTSHSPRLHIPSCLVHACLSSPSD